MKTLADIDALTGLYNRNAFYRLCQETLEQCRLDSNVSVVIVDIGELKQVNYQYDHASGDKVVIEVAKLVEDNFRGADVCARLTGQTFAIICPDSNFVDNPKLLKRLYEGIESLSVTHNNEVVEFAVSIGATTKQVVDNVDPIADIETMISAAKMMVVEAQSNQLQLSTNYS